MRSESESEKREIARIIRRQGHRKLKRDKVVSIVNGRDRVGIYFTDTDRSDVLLKCSPAKADKIIKLWNKK